MIYNASTDTLQSYNRFGGVKGEVREGLSAIKGTKSILNSTLMRQNSAKLSQISNV